MNGHATNSLNTLFLLVYSSWFGRAVGTSTQQEAPDAACAPPPPAAMPRMGARGAAARRAAGKGGAGQKKDKKKAAALFQDVEDPDEGLVLLAEPLDFLGRGETLGRRFARFVRNALGVYGAWPAAPGAVAGARTPRGARQGAGN